MSDDDIKARLRETAKLVDDLIWKRAKPTMRIPADPERDTDLVISQCFSDALARIVELEAEVARLRNQLTDYGMEVADSGSPHKSDGCGRPIVDAWFRFCGETDMGQTAPWLCVECGGTAPLRTPQ